MSSKTETKLKQGSAEEILSFASNLLAERSKRTTYITLKRLILEVYTENSFQRHKLVVQTMLEEYHKRLTPARPKKRQQTLSPRTDGRSTEIAAETGTSSSSSSSVASASATSSDSRKKKAPKLYFYEMSEEDDKAAEGNRFIRNKDL
tara:strand:- start:330 stop:773 length:444 start_codon:yes stop_codon:yes gene_type:complete